MADNTNRGSSLTLKEAGGLWLRRAKLDELEESTIRQYRQHLHLHIEPFIGQCELDTLGPPAIESFKDELLQTRSRAMARKVMISLKGVLNEAVRLGYVNRNSAISAKVRQQFRRGGGASSKSLSADAIPTKPEIRALLEH